MTRRLDQLEDALNERVMYKVRTTRTLTKLYEKLSNLQEKSAQLAAEIAAVNTEIKILVNSATEVEHGINEAVINLSMHPDFK